MAIHINSNFQVGSPEPLDTRTVLTKAEMLTLPDAIMPDVYFAICSEDSQLYLYTKTNTPNAETGKFEVYTSGNPVNPNTRDFVYDEETGDLELAQPIFTGTSAEWNALTAQQKAEYAQVNLTDDITGGNAIVVDEVANGNLNPVTSNAVYEAINILPLNNHFNIQATTIGLPPVANVTFDNLIRAIYNTYGEGVHHISFIHSNAATPTLVLPDGSSSPMAGAYMTGTIADFNRVWQRSAGLIIIDVKAYMWNVENGSSTTPVITIKQLNS